MTHPYAQRLTLKTRITVFTLAVFLLSTWSLAFYASAVLRQDLEKLLGEQQFSAVSTLATGLNSELTDRLNALEAEAASALMSKPGDAAAVQKRLDENPVLQTLFNAGVIAFSMDGTAIAETPVSGRIGVNYMDVDSVATALRQGRANIGSAVMGKKLASPVFGITVPVRDAQGQVIGALAGVVNLGNPGFMDKLGMARYGKTGSYVVVDRRNRQVITASDKQRVIEPFPAKGQVPTIDRFVQGYEGSVVFTSQLGDEVLASVKGVPVADWYVGVILGTTEAFAPIHAMQTRMLWAALGLSLLAGAMGLWLLRRHLSPLLDAVQTLATMSSAAEPPHSLPVARQDEVGQLIGGFNRLLQTLALREAALRDGSDALHSILATTLDGYWRVSPEGRLLDVNPTYCQQSGYTREELLTLSINDLEAKEDAVQTAQHIQRTMAEGHAQFVTRHRRKDGSDWYVEVSATFREVSGGQFVVFLRNIDERMRAQQLQADLNRLATERLHLASIVESSENSITSVSLDGRYTSWNQGAEKMFGYLADEMLGRSMFDMMPAAEGPKELARLERIARNESIIDDTSVRLHKSGRTVYVSLSISPVRDINGQVIGASRIAHDITARKQAEDALEESNVRFRDLVASTDGIVWEGDASTFVFNYVSPNAERMLGYPVSDWLQPGFWADHLYAEDREHAVQYCVACTGRLENHDFEYRFVAQDGHLIWLRDIVRVVEQDGKPRWLRGLMVDISAQKLIEQRLLASQELLQDTAMHKQTILDSMADAVITINDQGVMESFNQAASHIFGYEAQEVLGQNVSMLMPEPHRSHHDAYLKHHQRTGEERVVGQSREVQGQRKDGGVFPLNLSVSKIVQPGKTTFVGLIRDITRQRQDEEEIRRLAYFDSLTGLANRRLQLDRLKHAMLDSSRTARHGALMLLDLDNFKVLNDSQGHQTGDLMLQQVAARLMSCVREGDSVARLGGDEFVVLLTGLSTHDHEAVSDVRGVANKIRAALSQPYVLQACVHNSSASIGIVLFLGEQEAMDELMKKADVAMYQAKAAGRNAACFYDQAMQAMALERSKMEEDIRDGLLRDEFLLHYQIQVNTHAETTGVEALVRWRHPTRGLVPPLQFIALAEETGLILPLGQWVLESACAQLAAWAKDVRTAHWTMAVNVSALQFAQTGFVGNVDTALQKTGANPHLLKLELTESMLVKGVEDVIVKMNELKTRGVSFSLDDFGTGYSSLAYLKRLPLNQLKIDQGFVRDILVDPNDAAIARMVIALADTMGLSVIAEGVEQQDQRDFLSAIGCRAYQGYLFGRPVAAADVIRA